MTGVSHEEQAGSLRRTRRLRPRPLLGQQAESLVRGSRFCLKVCNSCGAFAHSSCVLVTLGLAQKSSCVEGFLGYWRSRVTRNAQEVNRRKR
jgi:hypothetical protein